MTASMEIPIENQRRIIPIAHQTLIMTRCILLRQLIDQPVTIAHWPAMLMKRTKSLSSSGSSPKDWGNGVCRMYITLVNEL